MYFSLRIGFPDFFHQLLILFAAALQAVNIQIIHSQHQKYPPAAHHGDGFPDLALLSPIHGVDAFLIHLPKRIVDGIAACRQKLQPAQKGILTLHRIIPEAKHDGIAHKY